MQQKAPTFSFILIIYILSNFPLLINNGVFWDDWAIYNHSKETLVKMFGETGSSFVGYLHWFLLGNEYSPLLYRVLTFLLGILTIVILSSIIKLLRIDDGFFRWFLALYAVIPYFTTKNTMICFPSVLCYFLFILATYLVLFYAIKFPKWYVRVFALLLFFISFFVNSLVVFYIVPVLILYIKINKIDVFTLSSKSKIFYPKFLVTYIDFLCLPIIFSVLKFLFMEPSGVYSNYNVITSSGIIMAFLRTIIVFYYSGLCLARVLINEVSSNPIISFVLLVIIGGLFLKYGRIEDRKTISQKKALAFIGVFLFYVGAFPYIVVRKVPSFVGWSDRHQLLLSIGASLLCVSLVHLISKKVYTQIILVVLVSFCSTATLMRNMQYLKSWIKKESLMTHFKSNQTIREHNTFVMFDSTDNLDEITINNWTGGHYVAAGMFRKSLGVQTHFGSNEACYERVVKENGWNKMSEIEQDWYNVKDYDFNKIHDYKKMYIGYGKCDINQLGNLFLMISEYYSDRAKFNRNVTQVLTVKVE